MKYKTALTKVAGRGVLVEERDPLFVLISTPGVSDVASLAVKSRIIAKINDVYLANVNKPFAGLKLAVGEMARQYPETKVALCVVIENIAYFASRGASVAVLRKGRLAKVLTGEEVKTASGFIMPQDTVVLSTNNLFENFLEEEISEALINNEAFELAKKELDLGIAIIRIENQEMVRISAPAEAAARAGQTAFVSPVRLTLVSIIDKILTILPKKEIIVRDSMGPPQEEIANRKRRLTISLGVILLALLVISIFFGIKKQGEAAFRSRYEGRLVQAEHDFSEAKSLSTLNPARARELVINAKTTAEELEKEGIKDERLTVLLAGIKTGLGEIAGIYDGELDLFLDLSLISSGFKADQLAYSEGRIVALDKDGKKLVSINAGNKRTIVAAGPDVMPSSIGVTAYSDRNFVLSSDGVWEVGEKAENLVKKDWDGEVLIAAYSGNLYVLDKNAGAVWRYPGDGPTFGIRQNWFGPGIKPDLSTAVAWAIDGSIWILGTSGNIFRYSLGSPQAFSLSNVDKDFIPASLFVSDETRDLYLLDLENGRVVVFGKDGVYKAQYLGEEIKEASQVVVSEKDKKIILLSGTKLFAIEIKHL